MKRITKLEISNFRAFFDSYEINLPRGENLLIYGENGSGKSSIFKSVNNFLSSSLNPAFPFIRHYNRQADEGIVTFTFNDYDPVTHQLTSPIGQVITFGTELVTTSFSQFVKEAELIKGFLDYRSLLAVYNHTDPNPNLFELIIIRLLETFTPIGSTFALSKRFVELRKAITIAYTRQTWAYRTAIQDLATYDTVLRNTLNNIFLQLNKFLIRYFKLNLRVWYNLKPFAASTNNWRSIPGEFYLEIKLNGTIVQHQSDFLNEARLSALSICLYLATLKRNPQNFDYKILFLDDVFIGLDLTNRLPILEIVKKEFSDYQVFISTYDRHLYELAKRKFETESPNKWKTIELYVGKGQVGVQTIEKPILVIGETNFDKATQYLHDRRKPDYPAAANYFRKALEELIQDLMPKWEIADTENTQLPDYQLTQLVLRVKRFLANANNNTEYIDNIISLLSSLLHPLSHHEISSPIYRGELIIIENSFLKLRQQLGDLDIPNNFKCCLEQGKRLKITFKINAGGSHFSCYELILKEALTMKKNGLLSPLISKAHCVADRCYGHDGTKPYPTFNPDKKSPDFNYDSLENAYDKIYNYLIVSPIGVFPRATDYLTTMEYHDGNNWSPIRNKIVW